ncbi:MAG: DUF4131 domain-containing protein [Pedobacter sp.]|nr:MAG: DUF4131 domain-containing protein [Pedobacter sp.]
MARIESYFLSDTLYNTRLAVQVYLNTQKSVLKYNYEYIIKSPFKEISSPLNPAEFNFKKFLNQKNIWGVFYLQENDLLISNPSTGKDLISLAKNIRDSRLLYLNQLFTNSQDASFLATLLLGYRTDLNPQTTQLFINTGTIHALSVSGMHVGIIYLVLKAILPLILNPISRSNSP